MEKKEPRDNVPIQLPEKGACACLMLLGIPGLFPNADVLWLTLLWRWSAANTAERSRVSTAARPFVPFRHFTLPFPTAVSMELRNIYFGSLQR
jgi:hypothetical protein